MSQKYSKSIPFIRKRINAAELKPKEHCPQALHVVADVVFFGREYGISVFRSPRLKKNLCWAEIKTETPLVYLLGKRYLESLGYKLTSATIDGKRGVLSVFKDIPVQMCHFHQSQIITRYLTRRPKLEAGKELRQIALKLTETTEDAFSRLLNAWHDKWESFLKEKTADPLAGKRFFTHRRLRSAYQSLVANLPHLFIYQKYPKLNISNTTNSLDGSFSHLKTLLRVHRGQNIKNRKKMIDEILKNQPE